MRDWLEALIYGLVIGLVVGLFVLAFKVDTLADRLDKLEHPSPKLVEVAPK